ncbi:hypothetical protein PEX1_093700 [Penicillium expansum]|uniref:Uncharacterized protein n=1 Tax=Penicillium expansum TaxID=27334 RepID=A0A0A2J7Z5_PENEN|nr:hypothetical protein PEX2_095480 [Penicillium expansum]KGO38899.1 hypothetical protein PEX1_093700 [Penicillium expansum]KGO47456.1 hypothetical protein PEXP_013050 [Penicillium expansum]KGO50891.1 hypothetical protein PEX2_095480 [Penicillium expansum]
MSLAKNILLFGATGNIGSFILDAILPERSQFGRIAIFTSPHTAETKVSQLNKLKEGVEVIVGNVEDENAVKAAYKVRAYLEDEISRDDLAYSYVVTGPFAEMYLHLVPGLEEAGGWDVKERRAVLLGEKGKGEVSLTTMKDVGTLVLNTLLHATAETRNAALCVNSFTTSPDQIQAEFERQLGGQPWNVSRTSLEKLRKAEAAAWEAGNPATTVLTLRRIWGEGGTLYAKRANELIGEPKVMGLEDVVANEIQRVSKL